MTGHENAPERLMRIRQQIENAAEKAGRQADEITLIAVSKTFDAEDIRPVIQAGQRHFGENRVQEAQRKWPDLLAASDDITLHLIGPLQSNKARDAVALFDVIHTIDRPKIAVAIAREMKLQNRSPQLHIQVNTGDEPQKAGVSIEEAEGFLKQCRDDFGLSIAGLMCIPPAEEAAETHFHKLAELAHNIGVQELSMGMSADFGQAIGCGATYVRVGSAIFGTRPKPLQAA